MSKKLKRDADKRTLFTLSQKVYTIKMYYQKEEHPQDTLTALGSRFGIKSTVDNLAGVMQIVGAFERTGSVIDHFYYNNAQTIPDSVTKSAWPNRRKKSPKLQVPEAADDDLIADVVSDSEQQQRTSDQVDQEPPEIEVDVKIEDQSVEGFAVDDDDYIEICIQEETTEPEVKVENETLCTECGLSVLKKDFRKHKATHKDHEDRTPEGGYMCSHPGCNKVYRSRPNLLTHQRQHDPHNLQFICEVCGHVSRCKKNHKNHMLCHSDEKPHECSYCPMKFRRLEGLKKHLMTHTGEKPLSCTVCNAKFRQHMSLSSHMRLHTGERPYACSHCHQRFISKQTLNTHLKKFHVQDYPNECELCGGRFKTLETLRGHLEKKHGYQLESEAF